MPKQELLGLLSCTSIRWIYCVDRWLIAVIFQFFFFFTPVISFHPLPLFCFELCLIFSLPALIWRGKNVNLILSVQYCFWRVGRKRRCTETCKLNSKHGFFILWLQANSSKWHTTDSFRLHERVCNMMEGLKTYSEVVFSVPSIEITGRPSRWDESLCIMKYSAVCTIFSSWFWEFQMLKSAIVMTNSRSVTADVSRLTKYMFICLRCFTGNYSNLLYNRISDTTRLMIIENCKSSRGPKYCWII